MQELKKLQKLEAQYKDAYQKGDFIQAQKFHLEIAKMRSKPKLMKLSDYVVHMNPSDQKKAFRLLKMIPVYADLLEGCATDMEALLKNVDNYAVLAMSKEIQAAKQIFSKLARQFDRTITPEHAAVYGEQCDMIADAVNNILFGEENNLKIG